MPDESYKPDPVGGLVRDALLRFPDDRAGAIAYVIKHGPATPEAAEQLVDEALREVGD